MDDPGGYAAPLRPRRTVADIQRETREDDRRYARQCIRASWIIAALLTAAFAWVAQEPPFAISPPMIQVMAVGVNGLIWWLATSKIWFRKGRNK